MFIRWPERVCAICLNIQLHPFKIQLQNIEGCLTNSVVDFVCPTWLTWVQMHKFCCKIYAWSRNNLLLCKFSQCLLWRSGDISNPSKFLFALFGYQFFFCFLACLLLRAEPFSKTLPLILKLISSGVAKFEISVYFKTTLNFSGLFSLYAINNFSYGLCESQGT